MLSREPAGRSLPTLITLLVIGILLMTFDVRSEGRGVVGVLRSGAQTIVSPLQKAASFAVTPVVDLVNSLADVANLREENIALRRELVEATAQLTAVEDQLALLELYERIYEMEAAGSEIGRTVANVIGRPDPFDPALTIDKGTTHGVVAGQPVVDSNGYVVGTVGFVTSATATVIPITASRQGLTVIVGEQEGILLSQVGSEEMRLDIYTAREPVLVGDRVVTSAGSLNFPAGWPVGEIVQDASPTVGTLTSVVRPYVNPQALRLVVVLAWPPDPIAAAADEVTTTTTLAETSTTQDGTTTTEGGG